MRLRIKVNFRCPPERPDEEIEQELKKLLVLKVGDLIQVGVKRLCSGIFLGMKESRFNYISDEMHPHLFIADIEHGVVKVPLYDIFWFEVISEYE